MRLRGIFYTAFNAVQGDMTPVRMRGKNKATNDSPYPFAEDVTAMLDPIMTAHGFSRSISAESSEQPDHVKFVLTLRHNGGHSEKHYLDAPIDDKGMKGSPTKTRLHGMASSYTYCERHLLCKVFGVQLSKDTDGNSQVGPAAEPYHRGTGF